MSEFIFNLLSKKANTTEKDKESNVKLDFSFLKKIFSIINITYISIIGTFIGMVMIYSYFHKIDHLEYFTQIGTYINPIITVIFLIILYISINVFYFSLIAIRAKIIKEFYKDKPLACNVYIEFFLSDLLILSLIILTSCFMPIWVEYEQYFFISCIVIFLLASIGITIYRHGTIKHEGVFSSFLFMIQCFFILIILLIIFSDENYESALLIYFILYVLFKLITIKFHMVKDVIVIMVTSIYVTFLVGAVIIGNLDVSSKVMEVMGVSDKDDLRYLYISKDNPITEILLCGKVILRVNDDVVFLPKRNAMEIKNNYIIPKENISLYNMKKERC